MLAHPALEALAGPEQGVPAERLREDLELPLRARVRVAAGSAAVEVRAGDVGVPVDGDVEVWLDGEVAELFRPGSVAATVRSPGCAPWSLVGDLAGLDVAVAHLA